MKTFIAIILTALVATSCADETKVQRVTLSDDHLVMSIGDSHQIEMIVSPLSAAIYNSTGWKSSDPNVAQVDDNGNVTAVYSGECVVTGRAAHVEAQCSVTVVTPTYSIVMPNAIVFNEGTTDNNTNRLVARLYSADLAIDSTGAATGNGTMLNLALFAPISEQILTPGQYTTATTEAGEYFIAPGELVHENGATYITGSFLGQYTDNGLSAISVTSGTVAVETDGSYTITCSLEGEKNEHIDVRFSGTPRFYSTDYPTVTSTIYYSRFDIKPASIEGENSTGLQKITFHTDTDTTITLTARTPLSASGLPQGTYTSNQRQIPFTLTDTQLPEHAAVATSADTTAIASATMKVSQQSGNTYINATISDINNNQYIVLPDYAKQQNRGKMPITVK